MGQAMTYRLWYAQLDVFDTLRRYLAILSRWTTDAPTRDRLFVSDFYYVNPSLLHLTQMTANARRAFSSLKILRPDQAFLRYPSPPILYNKMAGVQNEAMHNLTGRGLCDVEFAEKGRYRLSDQGRLLAKDLGGSLVLPSEVAVLEFITKDFSAVGTGKGGLRAATGLRRIGT
jgi:hypothetical protein